MAGYRGHIAGGVVTFCIMLLFFFLIGIYSLLKPTESLLFCLIGSLFPDIDTKSKGQRLVYGLLIIIISTLAAKNKLLEASVVGIISMFPLLSKHRGPMHEPWILVAIIAVCAIKLYTLFPSFWIRILLDSTFFCAGCVSHLLLDKRRIILR